MAHEIIESILSFLPVQPKKRTPATHHPNPPLQTHSSKRSQHSPHQRRRRSYPSQKTSAKRLMPKRPSKKIHTHTSSSPIPRNANRHPTSLILLDPHPAPRRLHVLHLLLIQHQLPRRQPLRPDQVLTPMPAVMSAPASAAWEHNLVPAYWH